MKSKYFFRLLLLLPSVLMNAQNVGIGTTAPTANLHVKTSAEYNMKLEDNVNGYASDYYITSDANGNFQKTRNDYFRGTQLTTLPSTGKNIADTPTTTWTATDAKITLPRGKWAIIGTFLLKCTPSSGFTSDRNTQLMVLATVASTDSATPTTPSPDILKNDSATSGGQGAFEGFVNSPVPFGVINGTIVVNNATPIPKEYTILVRVASKASPTSQSCNITNFGLASDPESMLFAIPN